MKKNETLTLWLSVGAAIFASYLVYAYTKNKKEEISRTFGVQTSVVVAVKAIPEMQTVQEDMVDLRSLPAHFVQPGHVKNLEEIIGMVALAPINKGEQLLKNKIIKPGIETGLSLQVSPGKRAVTIPITEVSGVARLLKPGDRVDVVTPVELNTGTNKKTYITTLLQQVVILATGVQIMNELPRVGAEVGGQNVLQNLRMNKRFSTVTLEVDPYDAQKLIYILVTKGGGSLYLTLRHPLDDGQLQLRQTGLSHLLQPGVTRKPSSQQSRGRGR